MKKSFGIILISTIFLISCQQATSVETSGESSNNSISSSEMSEDFHSSNTFESEDFSSSDTFEFEFDRHYKSNSWDEQLLKAIAYFTGEENSNLVPSVNADSYEYYFTIDEYSSVDILVINCNNINPDTVVETYEKSLTANGFQLGEQPYGFMELNVTDDLMVQYALGETNLLHPDPYLELIVYTYATRMVEWPKNAISLITAEEVPEVKAKSYEAIVDYDIYYRPRLDIICYNTDYRSVSEYEAILENAGYTIEKSINLSTAVTEKGTRIMYSFDTYDYSLTLYVSNDWPYVDIMALLGFDLPRLDVSGAEFSFQYYTYDDGSESLALYYEPVAKSSLATYGSLLEEIEFSQYGQETTEVYNEGTVDQLTITSRDYLMNEGDEENEHWIQLLYCEEQSSLAIVIYW